MSSASAPASTKDTARSVGLALAGCGGLAWVAGACVSTFFASLVIRDGRMSNDVTPVVVASAAWTFVSFVTMSAGLTMVRARRRALAAGESAPFPWQRLAGGAALVLLIVSCLPFAGALSAYRDSQQARDDAAQVAGVDVGDFGLMMEMEAEAHERSAATWACFGSMLLAVATAGAVAAVALQRRHAAALARRT